MPPEPVVREALFGLVSSYSERFVFPFPLARRRFIARDHDGLGLHQQLPHFAIDLQVFLGSNVSRNPVPVICGDLVVRFEGFIYVFWRW